MGRRHLNIALMRRRRAAQAAALSGARTLVQYEAEALALDFTDNYFYSTTSLYGSAYVKDTGTPANNYNSTPYGLLTYTSPSAKMTRGPDGLLRFGAHNICLQSETFDNATWVIMGGGSATTVSANAGTAPNGTTTADKFIPATSSSSNHGRSQQNISTRAAAHTLSVYVKAGGYNFVEIAVASTVSYAKYVTAGFNLSTGAYTASRNLTYTTTAQSITDVGDGWYLLTMTTSALDANSTHMIDIKVANTANFTAAFTGDGTSGMFVWGAHLRRTPSDSTYLATTTAARYALPYEWDASGNLQGILIEEARTNSLTYSEQLDNAAWTKANVTVTANATSSPDGQTTMDRLVETAVLDDHGIYQSLSSRTTDTFSFFAKAGERTFIAARVYNSSNDWVTHVFNLSTGVRTQTSAGSSSGFSSVSSTIEAYANSCYRITLTSTRSSGTTYFSINLATSGTPTLVAFAGSEIYAGNTANGLYVWGCGVQAGSFPTSYIPTIGSTVTRAADNITLATSKFPWQDQPTTLYGKWKIANINQTAVVASLDKGAPASDRITIQQLATGNAFRYSSNAGGTLQFAIDGGTQAAGIVKMAGAFATNDAAAVVSGSVLGTDAIATAPASLTTLRVGSYDGASFSLNGHIQQILVLPRRVSNADLQTLTGTGVLPAP